jgi:hypothetical protein
MIISQSSTSWSRNWCCTRSLLNSHIHGELLLKKLVVVNSRKRCCRAAVMRWFWDHFSNFHFSNFLWVCLTADQLFMRSLKEIISQACWLWCACKCVAGRQHIKSSLNHFEVTSQASWFCACQCTTKHNSKITLRSLTKLLYYVLVNEQQADNKAILHWIWGAPWPHDKDNDAYALLQPSGA